MSDQHPADDPGAEVFAQALRVFVEPEVRRRIADGRMTPGEILHRAQVVFFPDSRPNVVRINDEVRALAKAELASPMTEARVGDVIYLNEVVGWSQVRLIGGEEDTCGHITMLRTRDGWAVAFDAIYNRGASEAHLSRAEQFLQSARDNVGRGAVEVAVDNLWSACELAAKARLLTGPDPFVAKTKKHGVVRSRYNLQAKLTNIPEEFAKALNRLESCRSSARYVENGRSMSSEELSEHLATVKEMIGSCRRLIALPEIGDSKEDVSKAGG